MNNGVKLRSMLDVCAEIHIKRVEMMKLAKQYGINGEETVSSSQELDVLLNEYQMMQQKSEIEEKKEDMDNGFHVIQKSFELNRS